MIDAKRKKQKVLWLFAAFGFVSAIVCSLTVEFIIPDPDTAGKYARIILDYFPGFNFGVFLYLAGVQNRFLPFRSPYVVAIITASTVSWRIAIQVGTDIPDPFRYTIAGAVGALVVAIPLIWAWNARKHWLPFTAMITVAGSFAGFIYQLLEKFLSVHSDLSIYILFMEWQTLVFAACAFALLYIKQES